MQSSIKMHFHTVFLVTERRSPSFTGVLQGTAQLFSMNHGLCANQEVWSGPPAAALPAPPKTRDNGKERSHLPGQPHRQGKKPYGRPISWRQIPNRPDYCMERLSPQATKEGEPRLWNQAFQAPCPASAPPQEF